MSGGRREHNTSRFGLIGADTRGNITIWNDGAAELVGYRPEDVVGRDVAILVPEKYRARHHAGFTAAMDGGPRSADAAPFHLPVVRADESVEVFAVRFVFIDDPFGRPAGAMIVLDRAHGEVEAFTAVPAIDTVSGGPVTTSAGPSDGGSR